MARKKEFTKPKDGEQKEPTVIITCSVTSGNLEELQKAFAEGKLKQFGVIGIEVLPPPEMEPKSKRWRDKERVKKDKPKDQDLPPM